MRKQTDNTGVAKLAHGHDLLSKVPRVTLAFWVIKILATTLGETGGDAVTMTMKLGYAVGSLIFLVFFAVTLAGQVSSRKYHPFAYWAVVVATTTVGTTMSDYLDRTVGLGYIKSSIMLFGGVLLMLFLWKRAAGRVQFENITSRKDEIFYWVTILVSNTLGTALGDFVASGSGSFHGIGFERGAVLFSVCIAIVAAAHYLANLSTAMLFWSAYILTRPLGATLGDTLTKPHSAGGFNLSRIHSSLAIAVIMVIGIVISSRRTSTLSHTPPPSER